MFGYRERVERRKERELIQIELIQMETMTAKQIKNTFANVVEIEFSEDYVENSLAGFTRVDVTITTSYGVSSEIGVSMSPNEKEYRSYVGSTEIPVLGKGKTEDEVKIIFSNKDERLL